jgi:TIGR02646 family protein
MRKIERLPLDDATLSRLRTLADRVARSADPRTEAARLWGNLAQRTRESIRDTLAVMSGSRERCMYCEDSQGTDIDHFRPKSAYPEHTFSWPNHLLACARCNSNHKRDQFPLDEAGNPLLIDPTADDPTKHLSFSPTTGMYVGEDRKGATTIDVFALNRDVCTTGRRAVWVAMMELIRGYALRKDAGDDAQAADLLTALVNQPFQSLRVYIGTVCRGGSAELLLPADVISAIARYPELIADT